MLNVLKSDPILMSCSTLFSSHSGAMTISTTIPWIMTLHAEYHVSGCCPECHAGLCLGTSRMLKNVLRSDQVLMSCSTLFSSHSGAMIISKTTPWIITLDTECCYAECNIFRCCAECHYAGCCYAEFTKKGFHSDIL